MTHEPDTKSERTPHAQDQASQEHQDALYERRARARRALPPKPKTRPIAGLINTLILIIALTLILLSRGGLESNPESEETGSWVDYLITPKELRLPPSVTDQARAPLSPPRPPDSTPALSPAEP